MLENERRIKAIVIFSSLIVVSSYVWDCHHLVLIQAIKKRTLKNEKKKKKKKTTSDNHYLLRSFGMSVRVKENDNTKQCYDNW